MAEEHEFSNTWDDRSDRLASYGTCKEDTSSYYSFSSNMSGNTAFNNSDLGLWTRFLRFFLSENDSSTTHLLDNAPNHKRTLSSLTGVFTPVALSMFGTVLFIRIGFVVGQAGILETILQLFLAYAILVLTVFSICAISTNGAVEGGGAYYMISRALGPEFGGSIGFLFYVANVLACALYVSGFTEGIMENFGIGGYFVAEHDGLPVKGDWWKYLYATVVLFICLLVCLVGGSMFAKTLTVILGITVICTLMVFISIFATNHTIQVAVPKENHLAHIKHGNETINGTLKFNYTGLEAQTFRDNLYSGYEKDYSTCDSQHSTDSSCSVMNFATVFAILFSSVTGIMNGANMSGELKDPSKSIPKGTLTAVGFTFCTYLIEAILIGGSCDRKLLINNYIFLQDINLWPPFVLIGIFATTLSAALGNLIGASRILEALANDQLFWFILNPAMKTTRGGNPYMAVLITWILVQLVLLVGSLNAIAPATSVFFLLSYAATNLACMALDLASAPNFRPTFKYFSWQTSLLGLLGSLVMCFLISALYSSIAIIIMLVLIILLHFRSLPTQWGSISQALIFHQVRKYLLMLDIRKAHVKYWRPQILLMIARVRQSAELIDFINDIKKGGLYVIGHVRVGSMDDFPEKDPLLEENPKWMKLVDKLNIKAFVELTLSYNVREGFHHLVRMSGLGGMKPNTVCLGFYDNEVPVDTLSRRPLRKKRLFKTVETGQYLEIGEQFGGIRKSEQKKDLSAKEYVKIISDTLKMSKNVMLCRHFNALDKSAIFNVKGTLYIDVWPVNFFRPETASYFDNTCLFLLQLATVINMVPGWKSKTCLRVFLFVNTNTENSVVKEQKLETYLRQLRILARIQIVSWESISEQVIKKELLDNSVNYPESRMQEYNEMDDEFVQAINKMVVSYSSRTALSFLYLPRPPGNGGQEKYLRQLDELSVNLPPTVFVHGLHPVTSTTL
ncbi:solute carrier family 12 member 9-like isoform X2 [Mercenaria mercenaria]|uniref:solute carrier family 12 member 9-like isoform X2 n=1 Tax=Mercenaria mercenaria TaxID=6596 RepID=UPI00234E7394|nr:solute carrier family 12 member 9-like isoform X2 [Mercenaria mercenaria]